MADPEKDNEVLAWFRLLKRVFAIGLIGNNTKALEYVVKERMVAGEIGISWRKALKDLYTELPDGVPDNDSFALPQTKCWILGEIAAGWSARNPYWDDRLDCLLFLSAVPDTLLCEGNPYCLAFHNICGWKETKKCVSELVRAGASRFAHQSGTYFGYQDLFLFLEQPLQQTVRGVLWHALVNELNGHLTGVSLPNDMLAFRELAPRGIATWPEERKQQAKEALFKISGNPIS